MFIPSFLMAMTIHLMTHIQKPGFCIVFTEKYPRAQKKAETYRFIADYLIETGAFTNLCLSLYKKRDGKGYELFTDCMIKNLNAV